MFSIIGMLYRTCRIGEPELQIYVNLGKISQIEMQQIIDEGRTCDII